MPFTNNEFFNTQVTYAARCIHDMLIRGYNAVEAVRCHRDSLYFVSAIPAGMENDIVKEAARQLSLDVKFDF